MSVQEDGYLKFDKLSTCRKLEDRCYNLVGTLQYQAPEVFLCTGYDFAADFWSLGLILFELLTGYLPYDFSDPVKHFEAIRNVNSSAFPLRDAEAKDLIT